MGLSSNTDNPHLKNFPIGIMNIGIDIDIQCNVVYTYEKNQIDIQCNVVYAYEKIRNSLWTNH